MAHWNPWEHLDKNNFVEAVRQAAELVKKYEKFELGAKYLVPSQVDKVLMKAAGYIKRCEKYSAYYQDAKEFYEAIEVLNSPKMSPNNPLAIKAYAQLLKSLAVVLSKLPFPANSYSGPVQAIAGNFEGIVKTIMPSAHGSGLDADLKDFLGGGQGFIRGQ